MNTNHHYHYHPKLKYIILNYKIYCRNIYLSYLEKNLYAEGPNVASHRREHIYIYVYIYIFKGRMFMSCESVLTLFPKRVLVAWKYYLLHSINWKYSVKLAD